MTEHEPDMSQIERVEKGQIERSKDAIVVGEAECPKCGKWVELVAEPDMWETQDDGSEKIIGYWPATNMHCDLIMAEEDDGNVYSFSLPKHDRNHTNTRKP